VRYNKFEDDLYIMNPGSAGNPHDGKKPSFGTINIVPSGILMNIADI
jgi:predicted phosphodiesterase